MAEPRHAPKKHFGQHFLHDAAIIERIVRALDPKPGDRIVEIGPGQGALTLPLLRRHGALTVIELDRDLIAPLREAGAHAGDLEVIHSDVLKVDFTKLADGQPLRLVGNLPYNISSPILFHALEHAAVVRDMHFMLQKEVVDRMAAAPGSKVFGRLSVMLQASCDVVPLFEVPPGAFRPPPQVDSAVVRLLPRASGSVGIVDSGLFARVVREAFGQRRKTLRNALSGVCDAEAIVAAGLRPGARAEEVEVEGFVALANHLAARHQPPAAMHS
jgi:16S rRNA (adenine1518-N6/adenine1519-N6)-dimethyltransferase